MHDKIRENPVAEKKERTKPEKAEKKWKPTKLTYEERKAALKVLSHPLDSRSPQWRHLCSPWLNAVDAFFGRFPIILHLLNLYFTTSSTLVAEDIGISVCLCCQC